MSYITTIQTPPYPSCPLSNSLPKELCALKPKNKTNKQTPQCPHLQSVLGNP
ncbi:mCG140081 [Mus musculus]|nr:mCG140081 [Mus musculus]